VVRQYQLLGIAALLGCLACVGNEIEPVSEGDVGTHVEDWRDEIVYQLLTDRFANGDPNNDYRVDESALARYQGGDYQGIVDKLDYLQALGVTSLWISPIIKNVDHDAGFDAYHGYWAVDLETLNPHFGDLVALRHMVSAAHDRGMKVILDIVTNHMGQVFYYDMNMNGQPDEWLAGSGSAAAGSSPTATHAALARTTEYDPDYDPRGIQAFTSLGEAGPAPVRFFDMPEIFRVPPNPPIFADPNVYNRRGRVSDWNVREQVLLGDFPGGLKDINTMIPEVRAALIDSYVEWVLKADFDGFRIDTLKHVEYEFWQEFAPEVRRRLAAHGKHNFLMFGEAFDGDDALVGSFTMPDQLDSVFYFPQKFRVFNDVFMNSGPTSKIAELFAERAEHYGSEPQPGGVGIPPRDLLVNFIDNHDVTRFLFGQSEVGALHAALTYLFTEDGIPCLYYGTEQEYWGGNDPANREPLWWSGYPTDGETFRYIAELSRLRKRYTALRRGSFELVYTTEHRGEEEDAGLVAFERKTAEGDYALVVINASASHASRASFPTAAGAGTVLLNALGVESVAAAADGTLSVEVSPQTGMILVPEAQYAP
jgi:alpha-amylase